MKIRIAILGCLLGVVFLLSRWGALAGAKPSVAQAQESKAESNSLEIGVVNIKKVFRDCKRGARYGAEAFNEQQRVKAELEKIGKEVEAGEAGLRALKPGSSDYIAQMKELLEKRANYRAKQELYSQQIELTDQLWTKELYQDILRVTSEVAKEKGLKLVFREDEIDFSETNTAELGLAMRIQKLLYSGGCLDITGEIVARLDSEENR